MCHTVKPSNYIITHILVRVWIIHGAVNCYLLLAELVRFVTKFVEGITF
jgi:hypothetical protein